MISRKRRKKRRTKTVCLITRLCGKRSERVELGEEEEEANLEGVKEKSGKTEF